MPTTPHPPQGNKERYRLATGPEGWVGKDVWLDSDQTLPFLVNGWMYVIHRHKFIPGRADMVLAYNPESLD